VRAYTGLVMTDDNLEQLAEAFDDAMAPAALEVWREVWPSSRSRTRWQTRGADAGSGIELMRRNGLDDPERSQASASSAQAS